MIGADPNGNGRMSRLLTTLLFYRSGFYVGKYISLEAKQVSAGTILFASFRLQGPFHRLSSSVLKLA